jgi:hypothetical protein
MRNSQAKARKKIHIKIADAAAIAYSFVESILIGAMSPDCDVFKADMSSERTRSYRQADRRNLLHFQESLMKSLM